MDVQQEIDGIVKGSPVVVFMKGTPEQPRCGFSATVAGILQDVLEDGFASVDVLSRPEIRQGIKDYTNWPTIPQVFIDGAFVGGCDIVRELEGSGELYQLLGREAPQHVVPTVEVTPAAVEAIRAAIPEGLALKITVPRDFRYQLGATEPGPQDIVVEAGGIQLVFDASSARRADGLKLDYAQSGGFTIDNPSEPKVGQLTPSELKAMRDAGEEHVHLDVRTPDEFAAAKIEGARLLDSESLDWAYELPKDTVLVFSCHHGGRSQQAAQHFLGRGFTAVHNLVGGIDAWSLEIDASVPRY